MSDKKKSETQILLKFQQNEEKTSICYTRHIEKLASSPKLLSQCDMGGRDGLMLGKLTDVAGSV